jgi:arylsulfatase A-like enzyme
VHGCCNGNDRWADAAPLVTRLLADAGYDCGLAGKLHLAGAHGRIEPRGDDGYRVFHWSHDPRDQWEEGHDYGDWVSSQGYDLSWFDEHPLEVPPQLHQTTWCADRAIDFIEEARGDRPWLFSVNPYDPHPPLDPPQAYLDRYDPQALPGYPVGETDAANQAPFTDIDFPVPAEPPDPARRRQMQAAYYAMISLIDDNVGRMLDSLKRTGQRDNTIVVFTSDHGDMVGEHGLMHKGSRFYEPLVRVPLVMSWPGGCESGLLSDALVELIDLAPTFLEVAGVEAPSRMQGRSLAALLGGAAEPSHHRDFVRSEFYYALSPVDKPHTKGTYATMYRDRRHKLCVYHGLETGELYDLESDPGELVNLWDDSTARDLRFDLMKRSFDALALATDIGTPHTTKF